MNIYQQKVILGVLISLAAFVVASTSVVFISANSVQSYSAVEREQRGIHLNFSRIDLGSLRRGAEYLIKNRHTTRGRVVKTQCMLNYFRYLHKMPAFVSGKMMGSRRWQNGVHVFVE